VPVSYTTPGSRYSYSWNYWRRIKGQEEALEQAKARLKEAAETVGRALQQGKGPW
jgi:hypothetical protein